MYILKVSEDMFYNIYTIIISKCVYVQILLISIYDLYTVRSNHVCQQYFIYKFAKTNIFVLYILYLCI